MSDLDSTILYRVLTHSASPADRVAVDRWLAGDPRHAQQLEALRRTWALPADGMPSPQETGALWGDIQKSLAQSSPSRRRTASVWHSRGVLTWAVVGVAALGTLYGAHAFTGRGRSMDWQTATVGDGGRETLTLPDGTRIVLNAGSTLRYARHLGSAPRDVYLTGEGLFTVVHNAAHPFVVHVGNRQIRDIGTTFDVRSYTEETGVRVAVAEGIVGIDNGSSLRANDWALLTGDRVTVHRGGDVSVFTGWAQGRLAFNEVPLRDVVREVARAFNLKITIADTVLTQSRVTATFDNETADQVLDAITDVLGARYERTRDTVVIRLKSRVALPTHVPAAPPALTTVQDIRGSHE